LLAWSNVRERRAEIGVLRALGRKTSHIIVLFLGKAVLIGVLGGIIGCAVGAGLAIQLAQTSLFDGSLAYFRPDTGILVATVLGAPLLAAMASYLPTLLAIRQDPAVVLMDH
jgi:ABC-type lipoprotein release transport system permease subunit